MTLARAAGALAAAVLVAIPPAHAQTAIPGMTVHRVQAGELDATGWTTAASTEGRFSVRLPLKFNDFTVAESDRSAQADKTFAVGTKSSEGIKFLATRVTYRKPGAAKELFSKHERREGLAAKASRLKSFDYRGLRAVDMSVSDRGAVLHQRIVLAEPDLISLSLEAPKEHEELAKRLAPVFFDSLVLPKN